MNQARILIVDDEKDFREPLMARLRAEPYEYEIFEAENKEQALKQVSQNEPNIILLDMMLEGNNEEIYKSIIKEVNEQRSDIPVVVVGFQVEGIAVCQEVAESHGDGFTILLIDSRIHGLCVHVSLLRFRMILNSCKNFLSVTTSLDEHIHIIDLKVLW